MNSARPDTGDEIRHRLLILADMGNEPDEEQQMVHMIMCSNEFDLEGLVAVTGKYLQPAMADPFKQVTHPELFDPIIDAYDEVLDNLQLHADGWHDPDALRSLVKAGQPEYGMGGVGEGRSSPGSARIVEALTADDPRPLWVVVNAGSNTLAQALWDIRDRYRPAEAARLVAKLRVYENGAQDNAGAWACHAFPALHWIRSNYQTYCYGGPAKDGMVDNTGDADNLGPYAWAPYAYSPLGQHQWALAHIKAGHGPLGRAWPLRQFPNGRLMFIEGGGTIPWLGLVNKGLFSIDHPHWGGWSGRFSREKVANTWSKHASVRTDEEAVAPFSVYAEAADRWVDPQDGTVYDNRFAPVFRWRRAFFNDFVCRMDWCVAPYEEANHHPVAAVNGDTGDTILRMEVPAGAVVPLDASASSDPDGDDLEIHWWVYREAGTYEGEVRIADPHWAVTTAAIPEDAASSQIHVILEVKDRHPIAPLYDYRRIVIDVT
jgi:hypothetical protein